MTRTLPPLNAVRAFTVAVRHGSFTRAADELAVTHGAVSKQIATLEDYIGMQLFERKTGGVTLTDEGRRLRDSVLPAMSQLENAFDHHQRHSTGSQILRVATVASFAAHVLMPVLAKLQTLLPGIELEITTSDRQLDLTREAVDVAIRCGLHSSIDMPSTPLLPGKLIAVVRADLLHKSSELRRIHVFAGDEWADVNNSLAQRYTSVLHVEHFVVAIEAVLAGVGFAMLPDILVRELLRNGRLAELPIDHLDWPLTFNIICNPASRRQTDIENFSNALKSLLSS